MTLTACTPQTEATDVPRPTPESVTTTRAVELESSTAASTTTDVLKGVEPPGAAGECPAAFCLVYHIAPEAMWSDGSQVTAADFVATIGADLDPREPRPGYELITNTEAYDPKTVRVDFAEPYGPWPTLFDRLVPASSPDAADVREMSTSGLFRLVEMVEGEGIVLERVPEPWSDHDPISGDDLGDVTEIRFVYMGEMSDMLSALRRGDVDVVIGRPDENTVSAVADDETIESVVSPGPFWEHIDFHHQDPLLSQRWFRDVISRAVDRQKILDETVRLIDPSTGALDNTLWMTGDVWYEDHFSDVYDPATAEQALVDHDCEKGDDGVYVCLGRRLSFIWATTNDDPARRAIFDSVSEDLASVGMELVGVFRPPSDFLSSDVLFGSSEVWQFINFSWRSRWDPQASESIYYCGGELDVNRYCNQRVEDLVGSAAHIVDPEERAAVLNEADDLYLRDLALIPLYQKPRFMAWNAGIVGPAPNPNGSTDLWNVASWTGQKSVTVALPAEPASLDPRLHGDDNAEIVLSALLYGAFGVSPSRQSLPVLVDDVEVLGG